MNDSTPIPLSAPMTWYCGRCPRVAALADRTADLASYVCPFQHTTLVDLTKLKENR
jgi:hypothetical protein